MKGVRVRDWNGSTMLPDGGYAKFNGSWYCHPPGVRMTGNLAAHDVTEHEDGTITVSPSILIRGRPNEQWHGFLEAGVWREC